MAHVVCAHDHIEVDHQFAHAVLAQHDAPFDSVLVLSYDGGGNDGCFNAFVAKDRDTWPQQVYMNAVCPGTVYGVVASFVDEVSNATRCDQVPMDRFLALAGKAMAFAALGDAPPAMSDALYELYLSWPRELPYSHCLQDRSVHRAALLAAVQATRDERRYESAMLRTLGASRRVVFKGVAAEFTALGLLAGVLAAAGATVAGYFLAREVFDLKYAPDPMVWIVGIVGGALLVGVAGVLAARSVVTQPPVATLRQTQ